MNQVFQTKNHLHYGATIYISCFHSYTKFYMFSNGISFKSVISVAESEGPFNPAMCLFVITPVMKFQSEGFLEEIINNRYNEEAEGVPYDEKKTKVFIDQFEFELKQNNKLKDQQIGLPIKYSENFMLQHLYSSKYLCYSKNSENNEYSLELSEIPKTSCIFNLKACFNYQKDINTYVPFNSAAYLNVKIQEGLQVHEMNLNFIANSIFDSWVFSEESQDKIKVELYQTSEEIDYKNICFGDSVWIFHLETGSFVKVVDEELIPKSVILSKIKYVLGYSIETKTIKQNTNEVECKSKIIIQKAENEMSAQKFGLWILLPVLVKEAGAQGLDKGKFMGGKVKFDQEIRFFNSKYKCYLSVRYIKKGRNKFEYQLAIEADPEENTIFRIKSLSSSSAHVTTEDLFLIQNISSGTYIKPNDFVVNQATAQLFPSLKYEKQDNFKFTKIDFLQEWQNNNILSVMPFLNEGIRALKTIKNGHVVHRDEVMLRLMCENLIELLSFSYDLTEGFEASQSKLGKMTYNHFAIQKLLREQQVIHKLIEVLDIINPDFLLENIKGRKAAPMKMMGVINIVKKYGVGAKDGTQKTQSKVETGLLEKIVNTTLKILRNSCKNNAENSEILFKNSKVVIKFLSLGTYAQNFIMDSFNNEKTLFKISSEEIKMIIDQYIKVFKVSRIPSERLFQLLTKLIKTEDGYISKNQLQIYTLLFYKQNPILIPIKEQDSKFYIGELELNRYCEINHEMANILGAQIKFCAELTANRNYVCSKTIRQLFPLRALYHYMITDIVENSKIKESLFQLVIHCYLNTRPRFKKITPLVFSIPYEGTDNEVQFPKSSFMREMDVMKKEGLTASIIDDIMSCVSEGDSMTDRDLIDLKELIKKQILDILDNQNTIHHFYSSQMEVLVVCLKFLLELSVFKTDELDEIEKIIEKIAQKVDESLVLKNNNTEKLESTNFRELLLEMVEKNVIKKFNYSASNDGIEDEVKFDNICSIFVNYSFYQNILLEEKDTRKRKEMDSVITVVLELISIYSKMKSIKKIQRFIRELTKESNIKMHMGEPNKNSLIKEIIVDNILEDSSKDQANIFKLLVLLFYNSNTYSINYISLNYLFGEIYADRLTIESLARAQFNVDQKEKDEYIEMLRISKNIKLLIETAEIWLNIEQACRNRASKYDTVLLLVTNKIKQLTRLAMPDFDEETPEPLFCYKHAGSIIPEKQQILANLDLHQEIIQFILEYRPLILKIKSKEFTGFNPLLVPLFKACFFFLFVFIYDSPENKNLVHEVIKEYYLNDYLKQTGNLELGETCLIIEYLKNNYEECIEFFGKNSDIFLKNHKYSATHSRLLLTMFNFYQEPITTNLRKFYVSIFDFSSFKTFLWFKPNTNELCLDLKQYETEVSREPFIYHIHAIEAILNVVGHIPESCNTIKQHIKNSLSQEYLYGLLFIDDYYTKQNSNNSILKVIVYFKAKVMKLIEFAYFSDETRNDELLVNEFKRQNSLLIKLINEAPARQENEDFRKILLVKDLKDQEVGADLTIREAYENVMLRDKGEHILEAYLNGIDRFCLAYKRHNIKSQEKSMQRIVAACDDIHQKIVIIYEIIHKSFKNFEHEEKAQIEKYPVPHEWLFTISGSYRNQQALAYKKYISSFLIESMFDQGIYQKFILNEKKAVKIFLQTLNRIQLKPSFFLCKVSEFIEDAFEKLLNTSTTEMYNSLQRIVNFITLWIQCEKGEKANELRLQIGKSELIFPILNYFQTCVFDKFNKELFLQCIEFFNELIGEEGNRGIQTIFNHYFKNKADSVEFFMRIKTLFRTINFEDRADYKCKEIYDSIERLSKDSRLKKQPQFIILNFLIRLCKGNFRDNQIYLSSLRNVSNFNIMSGIWQILKYQSQKYKKNLINVENYHKITQCFSTIRELVEGPCVENQNQFLKRDFFLTVLDYFKFEIMQNDLSLEQVLESKLHEIEKISHIFTENLRMYLNRDKITKPWMASQVKYRCISLICSLLSENVNEESKSQLYIIAPSLIVSELDKIYERYIDLELSYTYENLEVQDETEVVLPLGFKLFELLQYYPSDKVPAHSPGLNFFKAHSRKVQVLHQKLCIVVFPKIPDQISEAYKQKFLEEVDRSSINSKLRGLQDAEVQNKQSDYPYGYLLLIMVIIITILDIILYNEQSLSYVEFFSFYPILRWYGENEGEQIATSVLILLSLGLSVIFLALEIKGATYFRQHVKQIVLSSNLTYIQRAIALLKFCWENLTYFHYLLTLILCILTIFNPFFDAVLLLVEVYRRSETFSAIMNAIRQTLDQLLVVLMFTFVITYVLTTFFYFYKASVNFPAECTTLYHCFVFSMDMGIRSDSGIAGYTDSEEAILQFYYQEQTLDNVVANFVYLFLIKVIIEQIIGAIMVDKFAELRENKEKLQEDEESFCFICGLARNLLDREEDGFEYHKLHYHNVWNYFQFLIYLRKSRLSNLSGIELFVYDQQKNGKLNWFPISRSYHMEMKYQDANEKEEEQNEVDKMTQLLDTEVNEIRNEVAQIWNLLNVRLANTQSLKQ